MVEKSSIVFQWLGTAGFRYRFRDKVILVDPFLTRNERARPVGRLKVDDMSDADYVFVSHGHFDHLHDVPAITEVSDARVYCSKVAAKTLEKHGVHPSRVTTLSGGERLEMGGFEVLVDSGKHIIFDARLLFKTIPGVLKQTREVVPDLVRWPCGTVLIFSFEFDDLWVTNMGSLGSSPQEIRAKSIPRPDVLFIPVQGHTDICGIAADITAAFDPRSVVPQHWDDFSPPISQMIDLSDFKRLVAERLPECVYYEPEIDREFGPGDIFS